MLKSRSAGVWEHREQPLNVRGHEQGLLTQRLLQLRSERVDAAAERLHLVPQQPILGVHASALKCELLGLQREGLDALLERLDRSDARASSLLNVALALGEKGGVLGSLAGGGVRLQALALQVPELRLHSSALVVLELQKPWPIVDAVAPHSRLEHHGRGDARAQHAPQLVSGVLLQQRGSSLAALTEHLPVAESAVPSLKNDSEARFSVERLKSKLARPLVSYAASAILLV